MNTGAILNRINFGLALAGGRLPGASLAQWPETEQLRGASREQQVDAVVDAMLGGQVSPDTRQMLMSGENPLAAKLRRGERGQWQRGDATAARPMGDEASAMRPIGSGGKGRRVRRFAARTAVQLDGTGAGRRAGDRRAGVSAALSATTEHHSRGIMDRRVFMKSGRDGARDDGAEPELPAPHRVRRGAAAAARRRAATRAARC